MSRLLKGLSSLMNGNAGRSSKRDATEADSGPSTLTTPLFPVNDGDSEQPGTAHQLPRRHAPTGTRTNTSPEATETAPPGALVPLAPQAALHKAGRKSSSRALNAVVRASTQVALSTHIEPTPPPKVARVGHRSSVVLTETERLRLQIMQVQLKLTGLGLYEGTIDGLMNHDLVEGVRHFQTLKGMRDSGMLTTGTLTALGIRSID
ncbi:MAG TPA: peptidoglycan-binding protein [Burkholderiaceae bacterium]|nr:peptidoglycan-binding protein [Burkholderiaceae bacterium]